MVVMVPLTILNLSWRTRATGARQLVVHDALEIMLSFDATYLSSFTPITMVMSSPVAGAERRLYGRSASCRSLIHSQESLGRVNFSQGSSRFDPTARAVAPMQALASLIRSVHLKRALRAACLSGRTAQSE